MDSVAVAAAVRAGQRMAKQRLLLDTELLDEASMHYWLCIVSNIAGFVQLHGEERLPWHILYSQTPR